MAQQQAPPSPRPETVTPLGGGYSQRSEKKKKSECESCVGGSFLGRSARARVLSAARTPNHPPIVKRLLGPPPIQDSLLFSLSHTNSPIQKFSHTNCTRVLVATQRAYLVSTSPSPCIPAKHQVTSNHASRTLPCAQLALFCRCILFLPCSRLHFLPSQLCTSRDCLCISGRASLLSPSLARSFASAAAP